MPRRTLVVTAYLLRFNLIVPSATSEHLTGSARSSSRLSLRHAFAAAATLEATRHPTRMHQRLLGF
jgi:hypothetical protein